MTDRTRRTLQFVLPPLIALAVVVVLVVVLRLRHPAPAVPTNASPPAIDIEEARKNLLSKVQEGGLAAKQEDHDRMADLTLPAVVEGMGGRARYVVRLKEIAEDARRQGFRIKGVTVGDPSGPMESAGDLYAVAPYTLEIVAPDGRLIKKPSYFVAVSSDRGAEWKFLDGEGLGGNRAKLRRILPSFPDGLELPAVQTSSILGGSTHEDDWVEFTSKSVGFKASFPSAPKEEVSESGLNTFGAGSDHWAWYYEVAYKAHADTGTPLRDRMAHIGEETHAAHLTLTDVETDGHPGLEASYERVKFFVTFTHRHRMFYVRGALYQLVATFPKGSGGEGDAERFFAGFHFLPQPD